MGLKKIVLTGGPCAGKSTALSLIYKYLTEKGYNVITINESATELINSGIKPFGNNKIDDLEFQKIILNYQLMKEKILCASNFANDKDTIVILDRGAMDNKAYLSNDDFKLLLARENIHEVSLLDNYDLVIHLLSAACGAEDFYTLSNNTARTETIEEARLKDFKTRAAWLGHDDLRIVNNDTDFNEKMQKVIAIIDSILKTELLKHQHKYLLDLKYLSASLKDTVTTSYFINQIYLSKQDKLYRLRQKTIDNYSNYTLVLEQLIGNSDKITLDSKTITEKMYSKFLLENYDLVRNVRKMRICFLHENQYFKIDKFDNGLCILEVTSNNRVSLPDFLPIIDDVTHQDYYNYQLSKKMR